MLIEAEPDPSVAGEASTGDEVVHQAATLRPDVVLLDIELPGTDGITAARRILAEPDPPAVLMLTTFDRTDYLPTHCTRAPAGS